VTEYDEPPEPTQAELDEHEERTAVENAPTVRIEGLTAKAVAVIVRAAIEENYGLRETAQEQVKAAVEEAIREAVDEGIKTIALEHVRPLVAEIVANGWPTTNNYGEATGKSRSLAEMLRESLFAKDPYRSHEGPWAMRLMREELEKALKGPLGEEIKRAQAMVRKALDDEVMGKFRKALKDGLGLKDSP